MRRWPGRACRYHDSLTLEARLLRTGTAGLRADQLGLRADKAPGDPDAPAHNALEVLRSFRWAAVIQMPVADSVRDSIEAQLRLGVVASRWGLGRDNLGLFHGALE